MPIKRIQFPDGSIKRVEVPDGATDDQILSFVQSKHDPQEAKQQKYNSIKAKLEASQGPTPSATDGMSGAQKFFAGMGKSIYDTGRGVQQLFGGMSREEVDAQRAQDADLMASGAGVAGNITGTVGQILLPGGALKLASKVPQLARAAPMLGAAANAFLPSSVRGAAVQGLAIGGMQQVGIDESRGGNMAMGGGLGFAGAAAPRVIGATYRAGRNAVLSPTTTGAQREAVRTIRDAVDNPDALMQANPSKIAGSTRTLFDETLLPGIARLETKARGAHGDHWVGLDASNASAREAALRTFAGDEGKIAAAQAARSKATNPLYAAADKVEGVNTNRLRGQIKRLQNAQEGRPAVQGALGNLYKLLTREVPEAERKKSALEALGAFVGSGRKSSADFDMAKEAMTMVRRGEVPKGQFASQAGQDALKAARKAMNTTETGHDKMRVIANVRLTLNDMLGGKYGGDSGAALTGARSLMAVKNQLDNVAAKYSPEFGQATQTFRAMSGDINRMQAGQELIRRGSSSIPDPVAGVYPLLPGQFGGKVKNLDSLVRDATGFRKATAAGVFKPDDLATIGAINDDLSRGAKRLPYGNGGGSHTASQAELGIKLAGKALLRKLPWMGPAIEHLDAAGQARVMSVMSEMLANPAEYRRVAAALPANERKLVEQAFIRIGGTGGALSPALSNASN